VPSGVLAPRPAALQVLLVDDTPDIRRMLRFALDGDDRFDVAGEAGSGQEGVALASELQPDLVLLDLVMPGRNGLDVLPELRQVAPRARVVILSGLDETVVEDRARSLGAIGYLDKGLSPRALTEGLLSLAGTLEAVREGMAEARSRLAADLSSAGSARRFVERTVRHWDSSQPLEVIKLLVSELVTNAVLHARSEAEVAVQLRDDTVRVEVRDRSPQRPVLRSAADYDTSGRGMALVAAMASHWGVDEHGPGKSVWFEVARGGDQGSSG
jgi:DNA-binding NarL/FixJ family response regulator